MNNYVYIMDDIDYNNYILTKWNNNAQVDLPNLLGIPKYDWSGVFAWIQIRIQFLVPRSGSYAQKVAESTLSYIFNKKRQKNQDWETKKASNF